MPAPVDCEFVINCSAVIWVRRALLRLETNFLCLWNISLDLSWREGKIIILSSNTAGCCLTITPARPSEARSPDASLMEVQPIRVRSGPSNLVIFGYFEYKQSYNRRWRFHYKNVQLPTHRLKYQLTPLWRVSLEKQINVNSSSISIRY